MRKLLDVTDIEDEFHMYLDSNYDTVVIEGYIFCPHEILKYTNTELYEEKLSKYIADTDYLRVYDKNGVEIGYYSNDFDEDNWREDE
jgi:hypothetical protein